MNINIDYQVKIHSYWHCGSGLAAGADVDALVIKDQDGFPYIPGKTMKGLVREAIEDYLRFAKESKETVAAVEKALGKPVSNDSDKEVKGKAFFTNAEIEADLRRDIVNVGLQKYLFSNIASTAIGKDGVALKNSLRRIEVAVPCELTGKIIGIEDSLKEVIAKSLGLIKHIGVNRNRGLGRCTISIKCKEGNK